MAGLLQQLENNEAVLLMYLAGELSPEDVAEVERMLQTDAALRQMLDGLRQAQDSTMRLIDRADAIAAMPGDDGVRRTLRAMRQYQLGIADAKDRAPAAPTAKRMRWWAYPAAAAAAVLLALLVRWSYQPVSTTNHIIVDKGSATERAIVDSDPVAAKAITSLQIDATDTSADRLATAERHLRDLETTPDVAMGFTTELPH